MNREDFRVSAEQSTARPLAVRSGLSAASNFRGHKVERAVSIWQGTTSVFKFSAHGTIACHRLARQ